MAVNDLNIGRDVSIDIVTQLGRFVFNIRTDFNSRQVHDKRKSIAADGVIRHAYLPSGWEGSFKFDRADAGVDQFFAQQEALYYSGFPITTATITETIAEQDGSISQYIYEGVQLSLENAGNKQGDDLIKGEISFSASRRIELA